MVLTTGTQRRKLIAMGKNPPNKATKPHISMTIPTMGQPSNKMTTPPKKHKLPFNLSACKKNLEDFSTPITKTSPAIQNRFPIASKPLSNSNSIPRKREKKLQIPQGRLQVSGYL